MTKRLTAKAIRYTRRQIKKGASPSAVTTHRLDHGHVRRSLAEFCTLSESPKRGRQPAIRPSLDEVRNKLIKDWRIFATASSDFLEDLSESLK